jgi:hypothetical protein
MMVNALENREIILKLKRMKKTTVVRMMMKIWIKMNVKILMMKVIMTVLKKEKLLLEEECKTQCLE